MYVNSWHRGVACFYYMCPLVWYMQSFVLFTDASSPLESFKTSANEHCMGTCFKSSDKITECTHSIWCILHRAEVSYTHFPLRKKQFENLKWQKYTCMSSFARNDSTCTTSILAFFQLIRYSCMATVNVVIEDALKHLGDLKMHAACGINCML